MTDISQNAASPPLPSRCKIDLGQMYVGLINARNTDSSLRWSRAQIFLLLNSSAFAIIPFLGTQQFVKDDWVFGGVLVLSAYGILLSLLWLSVTYRANHWVRYWNDQLANLEVQADVPEGVRVFSEKHFDKQDWTAPSFHHTLLWLAWSFMIVWGLMFLFSAVMTGIAYKANNSTAKPQASLAAPVPTTTPPAPVITTTEKR